MIPVNNFYLKILIDENSKEEIPKLSENKVISLINRLRNQLNYSKKLEVIMCLLLILTKNKSI